MQQTEPLKAATQSWAPAHRQEPQRFVCEEKLSSQRQERRGVMWWRFGLSCFTVGGLERQTRRIAKSSRSFQRRNKMEGETAEHRERHTLRLAS